MFEQEKIEWLKSIRAAKLPEPVVYIYTIPGYDEIYMLSERYIRETHVEDLKAQYKKNGLALRERNKPKDKRDIVREVGDRVN